jgi:hypothetical protein
MPSFSEIVIEPTPSSAGVEVGSGVCVTAGREVDVSEAMTVGAGVTGEQLPTKTTIRRIKRISGLMALFRLH